MKNGGTDAILQSLPTALIIGALGLIVCLIGLKVVAAASLSSLI